MSRVAYLRPASEAKSDNAKSDSAFLTISEVASELNIPQHVLRFWETRFPQIKPLKMRGGRRYYRPEDVVILNRIKTLLYSQGYTIKGAKKAIHSGAEIIDSPLPEMALSQAARKESPDLVEVRREHLQAVLAELYEMRDLIKKFAKAG